MERAKSRRRKFSGKKHSPRGIASLVIGLISDICLIWSVQLAFQADGALSLYSGSIGLLALVVGVIALALGIIACTDEEVYKIYPGLGVLCGALGTVFWIGIYLVGIIK